MTITRTFLLAAAVALWLGSTGFAQHSTGPAQGQSANPDGTITFVDVKPPPLATSQQYGTGWMIHIQDNTPGVPVPGVSNYAGFLFDLQYDGAELSSISASAVGIHVGVEAPGGPITNTVSFPGSQSVSVTQEPLAAWIAAADAQASGIFIQNSTLMPLVNVRLHAKNTTTANNSDIDVKVSQLGVIRHNIAQGVAVELKASDWVYLTNPAVGAATAPGRSAYTVW